MKLMNLRFTFAVAISAITFACAALNTQAGDWASWRGPNGNGVAEAGQSPPTKWDEKTNIVWRTPVPGRGHSSPVVVGDSIYLATADEREERQFVMAFDRKSGKQKWITEISRGGFPKTHTKNTHASPTVACDGERLFIAFHHHAQLTLAAIDLAGKIEWKKEIGPFNPKIYEYGYAPSPLIYESTVIIAADYEKGGYLAAYDRKTGANRWTTPRPKKLSFSSPIVAKIAGKDQLLISGCELVAAYNPATGKLLWSTPGTTMATCGTMIWEGDFVFASGGYPKAETICVKADGSGEVMWTNRQKSYEQSMLVTNGYVYAFTDKGVAYCWRAADGKEMWKERLSGPVSSSPILVGDTIYAANEAGTVYVFKADPKGFQSVATNKLGDSAFATPAFCDSKIYTRVGFGRGGSRQEFLVCIGAR